MGGKYGRQRKHVLFLVACIITASLVSCASLSNISRAKRADAYLEQSLSLMHKGDYHAALQLNDKVIALSDGRPPADRALFNKGLIYADRSNPEMNPSESERYFRQVIEEHPARPVALQAKVWIETLHAISQLQHNLHQKATQVDGLNKEREKNKRTDMYRQLSLTLFSENRFGELIKILNSPDSSFMGDQALFIMGLIYTHYDNPEKNYKTALKHFRSLIDRYPDSRFINEAKIWMSVLNVIEKAKQVDIEIEKKKKEMTK